MRQKKGTIVIMWLIAVLMFFLLYPIRVNYETLYFVTGLILGILPLCFLGTVSLIENLKKVDQNFRVAYVIGTLLIIFAVTYLISSNFGEEKVSKKNVLVGLLWNIPVSMFLSIFLALLLRSIYESHKNLLIALKKKGFTDRLSDFNQKLIEFGGCSVQVIGFIFRAVVIISLSIFGYYYVRPTGIEDTPISSLTLHDIGGLFFSIVFILCGLYWLFHPNEEEKPFEVWAQGAGTLVLISILGWLAYVTFIQRVSYNVPEPAQVTSTATLDTTPTPTIQAVQSINPTYSPTLTPALKLTPTPQRNVSVYLKIPAYTKIPENSLQKYNYAINRIIKLGGSEINGRFIEQPVNGDYIYFQQPFSISAKDAQEYIYLLDEILEPLGMTQVYY